MNKTCLADPLAMVRRASTTARHCPSADRPAGLLSPRHPRPALGAFTALLFALPALGQPTISSEPADQSVSLNATVQFKVTARTSAGALGFRWWFKDAALDPALNPWATRSTLLLTNVTEAMAGAYWAVVTDNNGSVTSRVAQLRVDSTFSKVVKGPLVEDSESSTSATWCDYDQDGLLDVLVVNFWIHNPQTLSMYHNEGNGVFSKVTNAVTLPFAVVLDEVWTDYDNDGDLDLFVSRPEGKSGLYRNDLHGVFVEVNNILTLTAAHHMGAACTDLDRDGWPDLFVATANVEGGGSFNDFAYRNVAAQWSVLGPPAVGALVTDQTGTVFPSWCDFDNDGDADLYLTGHSASFFYRNDGAGFFERATLGTIPPGRPTSAGVWADVNNDGFFDLYVSASGAASPQTLHLNRAGVAFEDVTDAVGLTLSGVVWGPAFGDYDNDGDLDLFVPDYLSTNAFFVNNGEGTFTSADIGSPLRDGVRDEGASWADYDNDGFLDLLVPCGESTPSPNLLYHNNLRAMGNTNHWLKVQLKGSASNRQGIGAKVRIRATIRGREVWQVRQIASNSSLTSGPEFLAHFGMGDATVAEVVRVEWPSGNVQEFTDVTPDQVFAVHEAVGITPVRPSASLGGAVTLTTTPAGNQWTYQWRLNGVELVGQTNRTLNITNVQATHQGRYSVVTTTASGITSTNYTYLSVDTQFTRIEMGSTVPSWGCGWGDYNNDGYPDLFVAEGASTATAACSLYRNNRDGTLIPATPDEAGDIVGLARNWSCPAWGDYDNDGQLDLFVTVANDVVPAVPALWRNQGDGRFIEATDAGSFVADNLWCAPIWGDYDRDGFLDLFVANAWYEPPAWNDRNALYFNDGHGRFRSVTDGDLRNYRGQLQGGSAGDMDGDGDLDILLTDPSAGAVLFENDGHGDFHRVASGFPFVPGLVLTPSWADYDNDGRLDVFVAVYGSASTSQLLHNEGNGQWNSIPLGPTLETSAGMWADYDNDGDLDLFISRGQHTTTSNLLYANNGDGTFTQLTYGSLPNDRGQAVGCAWADYDNNGFLDLFVTSDAGFPEVLYRNHGNGNHWIMFKLAGTASNRAAIGAKVRVRAGIFGKTVRQMREIGGANRHQNDLRAHFGLGNATRTGPVRIEWPSGAIQELMGVTADQILTVWEPPFVRATMLPNGACQLTVSAEPNRAWRIEASSDLQNWEPLATETHAEVTFQYTDTTAASVGQRFYRIAQP